MKHLCFGAIIFILSSCNKEEVLPETSHLLDQTFTQDLRIKGHAFDSLLIENCEFDGAPLI